MAGLARVGERITGEARFRREEILEFARLAGDFNPLHHDEEYARGTRFGGIIACGPQTASRFLGLTATHFSRRCYALGLEFTLRFRAPVRPDERLEMVWEVVGVEPRPKGDGEIARLEGTVTNEAGTVVLSGTGTVLLTPTL